MNKQPEAAIASFENAIKQDPGIAMAYRNLGWAYNNISRDINKAITLLRKGDSSEKTEPMYYSELDNLYELTNTSVEKRLRCSRVSTI